MKSNKKLFNLKKNKESIINRIKNDYLLIKHILKSIFFINKIF